MLEMRPCHDGSMAVEFRGDWVMGAELPAAGDAIQHLQDVTGKVNCIDVGLGQWDSRLVSFVLQLHRECERGGLQLDVEQLPGGVGQLLAVATVVKPQPRSDSSISFSSRLDMIRELPYSLWEGLLETLSFFGELTVSLLRLATGRSTMRGIDFLHFIEQCGPSAIGIITLISVLVGMILAYLGSVQLQQFGAQIYVADLVGIGMVREMGALMTAVIMAGRTGAAYAAQLGSMQSNEEIDAITTLGIPVMEFLVLPRMLALVLVMPMLCLYADVLGMAGGAVVAAGMDVSFPAYIHQIQDAVTMEYIMTGLVKSVAFGLLIAVAGCRAGIQSGRSSAAVGQATTRAVVNAIIYLIVADAAFNILFQKLGI